MGEQRPKVGVGADENQTVRRRVLDHNLVGCAGWIDITYVTCIVTGFDQQLTHNRR